MRARFQIPWQRRTTPRRQSGGIGRWLTRGFLLAIMAPLGACAMAPATASPAGTAFDGDYAGQTVLTRGGSFMCGNPALPRQLAISQGQFLYPFQVESTSVFPVVVPIRPDGKFRVSFRYMTTDDLARPEMQTLLASISGQVANGTLRVTEDDYRCTRSSVLQRR